MALNKTWTDGNRLDSADLNYNFRQSTNLIQFFVPIVGTSLSGIVAHSSTAWSVITTGGVIYNTANSGSSWSNVSSTCDTNSYIVKCKDSNVKAFACEQGTTSECTYSSDSGATWTAKTSMTWGTQIWDVSFPTANLIVVAGNDSATSSNHIQFSTDQGANWTKCTTNLTTTIYSIDMFDGTTGFCVDASQNIWKTTDGAANWTDTGINTNAAVHSGSRMYCLTNNTFIIGATNQVEYYNGTTCTQLFYLSGGDKINAIIKSTNGNFILVEGASSASLDKFWMINSTLTNFYNINIFPNYTSGYSGDSVATQKFRIDEDGSNSLLYVAVQTVLYIPGGI